MMGEFGSTAAGVDVGEGIAMAIGSSGAGPGIVVVGCGVGPGIVVVGCGVASGCSGAIGAG